MKQISSKFNAKTAVKGIAGFIWRHYGSILLVIFFLSIAVWGFVFWSYGFAQPPQSDDQSDVRIVKVKEADLRKIIDDIKERQKARESISEKTFPDPFAKSPEAQ